MQTNPSNISEFKIKALSYANTFDVCCFLDSNNYADPYSNFDAIIAFGCADKTESDEIANSFEKLKQFREKNDNWIFGGFSYDLKNQTEDLSSNNPDFIKFPDLFFFAPLHLIIIKNDKIEIKSNHADSVLKMINETEISDGRSNKNINIRARLDKKAYLNNINKIKNEISLGNIYETNFCMEFYADDCDISTLGIFRKLNEKSPTPFANYFKWYDKYIISATPERFLARRGNKIISQPIKGTAKRSGNILEDIEIKNRLFKHPKERQENVMIVDLVRNDLTKFAKKGTVKVEELFGVYSFKQVHQMVSTVICEIEEKINNIDIIKSCFPMGSMTGAPKIKAMQLMEHYENRKRGMYSGAVGYFSDNDDFDFNVIIRTILYNASEKYLSFHVGSAITYHAEANQEYEECLLKTRAILEVLANK
ncbi:anthranilate synthase component I family protein [Pedobacter sp. SD-b]|uniref:Anthranilate synthase component I family protein n=1 Tax=Pedobacter segetis TaxID=2793069 RepID=A0ABS1BI75_9SPHI|nr:anthranilate synthase component I family protein [Pedobacter segetis]MBK0382591.1 anthranilate synthase component I family protein [Pedobacter segetis]